MRRALLEDEQNCKGGDVKKGGLRALCSLCFQQIPCVRFFECFFGGQAGCFPARLGVVNAAPFCCGCRFFATSCNAISAT